MSKIDFCLQYEGKLRITIFKYIILWLCLKLKNDFAKHIEYRYHSSQS